MDIYVFRTLLVIIIYLKSNEKGQHKNIITISIRTLVPSETNKF